MRSVHSGSTSPRNAAMLCTNASFGSMRTTSAGLATALIRLCFVVQRSFGDVSRRHGLTPQHAQLLGVLARGPVGMAELGEALNLEKSSLTGLIDRAEARAL